MTSLFGGSFQRLQEALSWRIRGILGDKRVDNIIVRAAMAWRPFLKKTVFIGISGSAGKTTTKELLLGILSKKGKITANPASFNMLPEVAKTILRTRLGNSFCIAELSEDKPGAMNQPLALLQPSIGIVTLAGFDHLASFDSAEDIAAEIGKLVKNIPAEGTALINADDARVMTMARDCKARVITYGTSPQADLRADNVSSVWPDRLQLTVSWGNERIEVRTQLCGTHFVPSVLAAIGGGLATGMSLTACADGIAGVEPFAGRMQPITTSDGVTFIRDDFKAPFWTLDACFEFMKMARAKRKIIVIGELQECSPKGTKYAKTARLAQSIADIVVFAGSWASSALKGHDPKAGSSLMAFNHIREAAGYLNSITREGDLVLLKGSAKQDHLLRIILARSEVINCWRDDCKRPSFCDKCPHRARPSGISGLRATPSSDSTITPSPERHAIVDSDEQIIVGLGNPESRYSGTPHNVGYEVVDDIAIAFGLTWEKSPDAWIARGLANEKKICLVKIQRAMNLTGPELKQLSEEMSFGPEQCILVFDDLDLQQGAVRTRLNGGAGGHRGVASVLEAFQTQAFRRIKVGVGKPGVKLNRAEYVLMPFDDADKPTIDQSIQDAHSLALKMVSVGHGNTSGVG